MALDISAATGTDLGEATDALAKADVGNTKALGNMVPAVRDMIKDGASLDQIMQALSATVGGSATVAAESAEGRMKRLSLTIGETKEAIGAAFLPILEKLLPKLQSLAEWVQENSDLVVKLLIAFGSLAAAILAANAAMKVYTAAAAAVRVANTLLTASNNVTGASFASTTSRLGMFGAAAASVTVSIGLLAENGGRDFKLLLARVIDFAQTGANALEWFANGAVSAVNYINKGFNFLLPGDPFGMLEPLNLGKFNLYPFGDPNAAKPTAPGPTSGPDFLERQLARVPVVPAPVGLPPAATGGGGGGGGRVAAPTGGLIDNLTDLPVVGGGGGGFGAAQGTASLLDGLTGGVTVIVNAAIAEASLGDKIVEALTDYNRRSGPIDIAVA